MNLNFIGFNSFFQVSGIVTTLISTKPTRHPGGRRRKRRKRRRRRRRIKKKKKEEDDDEEAIGNSSQV